MTFSPSLSTHHASTAVRALKTLRRVGFVFCSSPTQNTPFHALHNFHVHQNPTSVHSITQEGKRFIKKPTYKHEPEYHYNFVFVISGKLSRFHCLSFASSILTCVVEHFCHTVFSNSVLFDFKNTRLTSQGPPGPSLVC